MCFHEECLARNQKHILWLHILLIHAVQTHVQLFICLYMYLHLQTPIYLYGTCVPTYLNTSCSQLSVLESVFQILSELCNAVLQVNNQPQRELSCETFVWITLLGGGCFKQKIENEFLQKSLQQGFIASLYSPCMTPLKKTHFQPYILPIK